MKYSVVAQGTGDFKYLNIVDEYRKHVVTVWPYGSELEMYERALSLANFLELKESSQETVARPDVGIA